MGFRHRSGEVFWLGALAVAGCGLSERAPPTSSAPPRGGVGAAAVTGTVVVGVGASMAQGGMGGGCLMTEVPCNGFDDDCDETTPDDPFDDLDGDGYTTCTDCNDNLANVNPGAVDHCGDGDDQDCDGVDAECSVCGDNVVEAGEVCDDGNTVSGDGCRSDCKGIEVCGDGLADLATEDCDPPQDGACIGGTCVACTCPPPGPWVFADVTTSAGLVHLHSYDASVAPADLEMLYVSGGLAAGDYDGDGYVDLYAIGGDLGTNALFRNSGAGTFTNVSAAAGVALSGLRGCGPVFADVDGDGGLDLFVGALGAGEIRLFRNQLDGTFADVTATSGIVGDATNTGAGFGDYDRDGDIDMALSHWGTPGSPAPTHVWRNDGNATFAPAGAETGVAVLLQLPIDFSFAPTFSDYDDDGWPDLLWANDFGESRVFHNDGGTFSDATTAVITDENGMGSAVGDYDNDGDLDWFVTSVWDPSGLTEANWGTTGNRLYENQGDGTFVDVTTAAGVREGFWGWGACFADFDNDGHLDIFHTNGFYDGDFAAEFTQDPSRLFLNNGDGTFTERAFELGIENLGQGRGVVCFDYDRDGDLDVAVADNAGPLHLFENRLPPGHHYLVVSLDGNTPNTEAAGSRITIDVGGATQIREIRIGTNYVSQNPALAHFGLGTATTVDTLTIRWPDQTSTVLTNVSADQYLTVAQP